MQTFRLPARGTRPPFFLLSPKDSRQTCPGFKGTPLECTECNCIHVPEKSPTSLLLPSCYSSPAPASNQIQPGYLYLYFLGLQIQGPGSFWGRSSTESTSHPRQHRTVLPVWRGEKQGENTELNVHHMAASHYSPSLPSAGINSEDQSCG